MEIKDICQHMEMKYFSKGSLLKTVESYNFKPIHEADGHSIVFCDDPRNTSFTKAPVSILDGDIRSKMTEEEKQMVISKISSTKANIIILHFSLWFLSPKIGQVFIFVRNPRLAYMNLVGHFYKEFVEISDKAYINYDCVKIGNNVSIGPFSSIGRSAVGFRRTSSGSLVRFPQKGGVIIGDNVIIQSCVCIDRGALGDTIIGEGTVIDNLVHIAHNVKIGKNCMIVANAMIAGSAEIGDNSWIAPSASILNGIKIGRNCVIGMGAVVINDIDDDSVVVGSPGKVIRKNNNV